MSLVGARAPRPRARKRFGQHFLHDPGVIARIVAAIDPQPRQRLVEIGPGLGALTLPLLDRVGRLEVIELDRDVVPVLVERARGRGELIVHQADVLEFDVAALAGSARALRLCGNLPYNISTPLLFHVLAAAASLIDMHFMLQKEVVDRMAAQPGGKEYGRLTVMLAAYAEIEALFEVGPGAFTPRPKVWSAIVRLRPAMAPRFDIGDDGVLRMLVTAAFSHRRKTLRNGLKTLLTGEEIAACGIDPQRRPETLSPAQFGLLAAHYCRRRSDGALQSV
jgi:16S rRNA (adenine1518-N6/adenine1519-N6)-dimethyltransferase